MTKEETSYSWQLHCLMWQNLLF